MDLASNIKNICRVCMEILTEKKYQIDKAFLHNEEDNLRAPTVVSDVLNLFISVDLNENLPKQICEQCFLVVNNVNKFKIRIVRSEEYFKMLLKGTKAFSCNKVEEHDIIEKSGDSPICKNLKRVENEIINAKVRKRKAECKKVRISRVTKKILPTETKLKEFKELVKQIRINIQETNLESSINEPLICTKCNKTFKTKYILRVHEKRHEHKGQYLCTLCGKGFNSQGCLNRHTRVHTGEKKYICEVCKKRFPSSNNLNIHMRIHTGVKPYLCNLCGKSFSNRTGLNFHVRTHTKEKPYVCDICGKSFGAQSHIDWHRMIHTGERPFPCTQCDKAFIKKCDLQRHEAVHAGLKPHECSFCGKTFRTKMHCQYHMMLHTEERPHKCPTCGKGFIRRYYLKDHIVKRHGTLEGTEFDRENCDK